MTGSRCLSPLVEGCELGLLLLDEGDGGVVRLLAGVHTLQPQHGRNLGLVRREPGHRGDGVRLVGEGDGLVLPDDQLLLGGEGGQVHLGAAARQDGQEEDTSYGLHHLETDRN